MVLIAATVCTKSGKALISRQFVEMTKARIEGLLAAFPKLMTAGRQHTFVETESVRYVYQPLDKLYMLLITTKASNILEDLETLRLFSRVIPEYCSQLTEADVLQQAFNLLFAFDEIVALGYRESVNLAQVRTFVEMDSHEEKVYQAVRQTQEREAANRMREKAKELQKERLDAKRGVTGRGGTYGGMGSNMSSSLSSSVQVSSSNQESTIPAASRDYRPAARSAMKLGSKNKDADSFVSQLQDEGESVAPVSQTSAAAGNTAGGTQGSAPRPPDAKDVHLRVEERLTLVAGRDGGIQQFELTGLLTLRISNEQYGRIRVHLDSKEDSSLQLQTHPNVDKDLFRKGSTIGLKQPQRPFPLNTDVGVLKWRLAQANNAPLSVNCWPSEGANGSCDVNIEYELEQPNLSLTDVVITIPLPGNMGAPVVHSCDGAYATKARNLNWSIPVIDASQTSGSMEFTIANARPNDLFPVTVTWSSGTPISAPKPTTVDLLDESGNEISGQDVEYSIQTSLVADQYEVV